MFLKEIIIFKSAHIDVVVSFLYFIKLLFFKKINETHEI